MTGDCRHPKNWIYLWEWKERQVIFYGLRLRITASATTG